MWVASDLSGILQVRITDFKWFSTLTLHVFLKLLVGIAFTHTKFFRL